MLRRLSLGLLASAISVASLPAIAQEGSADDLGVMSISLKDVVKPTLGFQGALQGAGSTEKQNQQKQNKYFHLRESTGLCL